MPFVQFESAFLWEPYLVGGKFKLGIFMDRCSQSAEAIRRRGIGHGVPGFHRDHAEDEPVVGGRKSLGNRGLAILGVRRSSAKPAARITA